MPSKESSTNISPQREPAKTKPTPSKPLKRDNNLLHYAAYFITVGGLVLVAQTGEVRQKENAAIAGAIAAGAVVSRDWYKARLDPSMAADPTALIGLFSEMLHAGRAQANTNAGHLKRVEFLQVDLVEAMRDLNDSLRLNPEEVEQHLRSAQSANLTGAFSNALNVPPVPLVNPTNNTVEFAAPAGTTHVPDRATVKQSYGLHRPGFDA